MPPRFAVGDRVRVKPGVKDPDFPDIPLGGWAGTVREVNPRWNPPAYLIEWNRHTLSHMHPVYRKRCERDGLEAEAMWLDEAAVEPDTGEPAAIEEPTDIATRPLRLNDPDDRVRAVFGLTSDDPLPEASAENVRRYREYLAAHLSFPFRAECLEPISPFEAVGHPVTIKGLLDAKDCDEEEGVLCTADCEGETVEMPLADLQVLASPQNRRLVADYSYWFGNFSGEGPDTTSLQELLNLDLEYTRSGKGGSLAALLGFGGLGAVCGVVEGAVLGAVEGAGTGALVGALLLGLVGCWMAARYGRIFGAVNRMRYAAPAAGALGALGGSAIGALLGAVAVAFVGMLVGGIVGGLAGRLATGRSGEGGWVGALLGAGIGALGLAFSRDREAAQAGALHGAWMGAVAGMVLALVLAGFLRLEARGRRR